jgi:ankyrin repeat protein
MAPDVDTLYPRQSAEPGVLPLDVLVETARSTFGPGRIDDYQLLSAAATLDSPASFAKGLALGFPVVEQDNPGAGILAQLLYAANNAHRPARHALAMFHQVMVQRPPTAQQWQQQCASIVHAAMRFETPAILELLLEYDFNLERAPGPGQMVHLAVQSNPNIMAWVLERFAEGLEARNDSGQTPLLSAASQYHVDSVSLLLANGANASAVIDAPGLPLDGSNLLHLALSALEDAPRLSQVVRKALPAGLFDQLLTQVDAAGEYPIHSATLNKVTVDWSIYAPHGNVDVPTLKPALSITADIPLPGLSPLGFCFFYCNVPGATSLLASGADIHKLGTGGNTGWHLLALASNSGHPDDKAALRKLAKILLRHGVSPVVKNEEGVLPSSLSSDPQFAAFLSHWIRRDLHRQAATQRRTLPGGQTTPSPRL